MVKLNEISTQPDVRTAFLGWLNPMDAIRITQGVDANGFPVNVETHIKFKGCLQPARYERTEFQRKEGERSWESWLLFIDVSSGVDLLVNDRIVWRGDRFKVMNREDWGLNGYLCYDCIKDFEVGG
jgi:hypothetical protein